MEEAPDSEGYEDMPVSESSDQEMAAGAEAPPEQHGTGAVVGEWPRH